MDIPVPVLVAFIVLLGGAFIAIATWAIRTVRRAAIVVAADDIKADARAAFQGTIEAQEGCISALQSQVASVISEAQTTKADLESRLIKALARIVELERIIREWTTVETIQKRKQADRHEAREVRDELRDDASIERQHARADRAEAREVAAEARATEAT